MYTYFVPAFKGQPNLVPSSANRLPQALLPSTPMKGRGTLKIFALTTVVSESKSVSGVNLISTWAWVFFFSLHGPFTQLEMDTSSLPNFLVAPAMSREEVEGKVQWRLVRVTAIVRWSVLVKRVFEKVNVNLSYWTYLNTFGRQLHCTLLQQ